MNVCVVVKINEAVGDRLPKNDPDQRCQSNTNGGDFPNGCRAIAHLLIDRVFIAGGQNKHTRTILVEETGSEFKPAVA